MAVTPSPSQDSPQLDDPRADLEGAFVPAGNGELTVDRSEPQADTSIRPPPPSSLPKRRNGKPQSCEPCRKAKSACDHSLPTCGRCARRGVTSLCIYHPNPMTRSGQNAGASKLREVRNDIQTRHKRRTVSNSAVNTAASNLLLLLSQQKTSGIESTTPDGSAEYLGPTSYNAVIRESMSSFDPDLFAKERMEPFNLNWEKPDLLDRSADNIQLCMDVLLGFPDQETTEKLLARYFSVCDVILHEPSAKFCLRDLWSTWGETLKWKDQSSIRRMAETLMTTPRVASRSFKTSAEWLESFTGKNLRIEMIGNFIAICALAVLTMPDWDCFFHSTPDSPALNKKEYVHKLGTAGEWCIRLATQNLAVANEPIIWLWHHEQMIQSQYSGDENGYLWRKSGQVATAVTSLGLHREDSTSRDAVPFLVGELRKRIFCSVFITDKQLATFTGRPPRLSRRYSHCQLPLDLTDEQLMAEGEELAGYMSQLDAEGWNRQTLVPYVTVERGFMIMSLLRDEVLELCLGPSSGVTSYRRSELRQRCDESYQSLPDKLKFNINQPIPPEADMIGSRVMLRLEFLLQSFLLDRLPVAEDDEYIIKQKLMNTSRTILEHIVLLARYRERLGGCSYEMTWVVTYFGLQSASLLAIELIKQHNYPRLYLGTLPRSEIVQLLSVFLFCLDMIGPEEGNYTLCVRVHKVIKRSLDKVLAAPEMDHDRLLTTPGGSRPPVPDVDVPTMMGPDNDEDFMKWLTEVDWSRGPWVDNF